MGDRRLVLADEPSGALDSVNGESIMRLLAGSPRSGAAVVIVTHDAKLAAWADRVLFLHDGHLSDRVATPAEVETLLERTPRDLAASGKAHWGGPGRRAVLRWAWRLARREIRSSCSWSLS